MNETKRKRRRIKMVEKASAQIDREVVVIAGALTAIGHAVVRQFVRNGALVAIMAHGEAALEQVRSAALIDRVFALPVNVSDPVEIESASSAVEKHFGPIGIWINDAVVDAYPISPKELDRINELVYLGVVHGTMAALRRMLPRNQGTIVQVEAVSEPNPVWHGDYRLKHPIRGFCDSLREELMRDARGIHLTMVQLAPEAAHSRIGPSVDGSRMLNPQAAAEAICRAAHNRLQELYVVSASGPSMPGDRLIPSHGASSRFPGPSLD